MDFQTIEAAFVALVQAYKKQSVGPAADETLQKFVKVMNQTCTICKATLKQLRTIVKALKHVTGSLFDAFMLKHVPKHVGVN